MKKILITGGAGFIGSNLTKYLLDSGYSVTTIDNFLTSSTQNIKSFEKNPDFKLIKGDIVDDKIFKKIDPGVFNLVFHLASPASPKQYLKHPIKTLQTNAEGTFNLLNWVLSNKKIVVVCASTSEVYGDPEVHPQKEDYWGNVNPIGIRSCYDEAKRFSEALCQAFLRKHNLDIRIARIFNTYGPNMEIDDGRVISNFINQALTDEDITIYGDGQQTRSFCYVSDMVEGLMRLALYDLKGVVLNLGNDEEYTIYDIAKKIKKMIGSKSKIVYKKLPEDDPRKRKPDLTLAFKHLQYRPMIDLDTGLSATVEYFRAKQKL